MSEGSTVGDLVAAFLEANGIDNAFGVISIHNMPMLDAIGRRNRVRFVAARGEAGALNMADAATRATGVPAAAITSTGTGAGNAAGALIEAQTAGVPLLHLTGQIETAFYGRGAGYIHEAADQMGVLRAVSKAAFHIGSADEAEAQLKQALQTARTAPAGPVSIEIPIDVQNAEASWSDDLAVEPAPPLAPDSEALDALADELADARRPLLWLGAGARHAGAEARKLADMGFAVITSTQGRAIVPENHPGSLGAFTVQKAVEELYATCDHMLIAGSRLRGNETLKYKIRLPERRTQIDVDPGAENRSYTTSRFLLADSRLVLQGLIDRLEGRFAADPAFAADIAAAREAAEQDLRSGLGPYSALIDHLAAAAGDDFTWVRDITISNTAWGNKLPTLTGPRNGIHAVGGGIGQGLPMAIGAAVADGGDRKIMAMVGDGGLQLCLGELATAVDERAPLILLVMNDQGYGVIRNIQDVHYGGRHHYSSPSTPDFAMVAAGIGLPHRRVAALSEMPDAFTWAQALDGPGMIEVDMIAVGPFARTFAGPPVRK